MFQLSRQGASLAVLTIAMVAATRASAQAAPSLPVAAKTSSSAEQPEAQAGPDITVTATRIAREGFDAPTPTVTIGTDAIRAASRVTIGEMLADLPQFRAAGTPTLRSSSTDSAAAVVDLRGLGAGGQFSAPRTLTLLNGHRFIGSRDLNTIPQSIIKRVDIVTGGASAAWGSGAVAGVVNIILDDDLQGLTATANTGISSRGDGARYGGGLSYGTKFAGGRGHVLIAGEYLRDEGLFGKGSGARPNLDSALFTTSSGQILLANDVNSLVASTGGVITSGALAGMQFNPDGTLSPIPRGSQSNATATIGGTGNSTKDFQEIASPFNRANVYARGTFEVSDALKLSADFNFTRMWGDNPSFPESVNGSATTGIQIQKDNAFLSPAVRALLASGPQTFFIGRIFGDPGGFETLKYYRRTLEGSLGASGHIGGSWNYDAYADYGELRQSQGYYNQRIQSNFLQAIDAVRDASGNIVCRVALTNPGTDCRPLNIFGQGNASQAATDYVFAKADQVNLTNTRSLLATGASVRGDAFHNWAGPVPVVFGVDYRRERLVVNYLDPLSAARALGSFNNSGIAGSFDVREAFAEVALPLINVDHLVKIDLNGAARYSDYSTSGGIWSWKYGGTARFFDDLLLRSVYSRDIRSPDIAELYTVASQTNTTVIDPSRNNQSSAVQVFRGGNTALKPEIANTFTVGATYSPHFVPGLRMSIDYYHIVIRDAIAQLNPQDLVNQCAAGSAATCGQITRDINGQITTINSSYINLASYTTRGLDIDVSYATPLSRWFAKANGTVRLRSITNYVPDLIINDGVSIYNRAGDVGDSVTFNVPKWRSVFSAGYDVDGFGVDARIRYVGGGQFDHRTAILNNAVSSRTYLDLGARVTIADRFTLAANVQNLFDRDPPFVTFASPFYDEMGRYFSMSIRVKM